jgi:DNA polymerase-3 subunit alpha
MNDGSNTQVAGIVTFLKLKNTKKGDRYATFTLEDLQGTLECVVWPDTYKQIFELLNSEEPVMVLGRLDIGDERVVLMVNSAEPLVKLRDNSASEALITLNSKLADEKGLENLKSVLTRFKGECKVRIKVKQSDSEVILALPHDLSISPSEDLYNEIEKLFGEDVLSFK